MAFHTLEYALFLPLSLAAAYAFGSFRTVVLIAASLVFYLAAGEPILIVWLFASTLVAWLAGRGLSRRAEAGLPRGPLFGTATAVQILLLAASRLSCTGVAGALGVSYFVFQAIAYQFDVSLERIRAERSFPRLLLSFCFFPKLLQGPIERAERLLPQLARPRPLSYEGLRGGILLLGIGLVKKCVFADRFGLYVDSVFDAPDLFAGSALLLALYLYALQIYLDFSGYTDIARGSARLFGIELTENFRSPYAALDIADFWRRWHISLSSFILDCVFQPLQMTLRRLGSAGTVTALVLSFLLCGLWHGASAPFLAWGLWHGLCLAAHFLYRRAAGKRRRGRLRDLTAWLLTFHAVLFGWLLFRSPSLPFAGAYLARISLSGGTAALPLPLGNPLYLLLTLLLAAAAAAGERRFADTEALRARVVAAPAPARWAFYTLLLVSLTLLGVSTAEGRFGYFRF